MLFSILRLTNTWSRVDKLTKSTLEKLNARMFQPQYDSTKEASKDIIIPFLGYYLTRLNGISETKKSGKSVDFSTCRKQFKIMSEIQHYQKKCEKVEHSSWFSQKFKIFYWEFRGARNTPRGFKIRRSLLNMTDPRTGISRRFILSFGIGKFA